MASGGTALTLTEFLLARIAEDEASAIANADRQDELPRFDSRRVLAECEAKRRITRRSALLEAAADSEPESTELAWHAQGALEAALSVAAVYADHPDCREEWKS